MEACSLVLMGREEDEGLRLQNTLASVWDILRRGGAE